VSNKIEQRRRSELLVEIAKHTGKQVTAAFLKRTADFVPGIERFHTLIPGNFKPAWSHYALTNLIKLASPYDHKDEVIFLEDGRWLMTYSPRVGGLSIPDNRALVKCMGERIPIAVFKQMTDKRDRKYGSTYLVLGLGLVSDYDPGGDVFLVESVDQSALEEVTDVIADEELRYEVQLYARLTNQFHAFAEEARSTYTVSAPKREDAFRHLVLREYDFCCAVCETKFRLAKLVEATAAHIVPKHKNGTDDPRNGLALCRTHHWAFDVGVFSLDEEYRVLMSPRAKQAETRNFGLLDLDKNSIILPKNEILRPHPEAIAWHRSNVMLK
jgi:hypothetical protein